MVTEEKRSLTSWRFGVRTPCFHSEGLGSILGPTSHALWPKKKGKVCAGHFGRKEGVILREHEEISEVVAVSFLVVIDL